jgi:hypothetical protein
MKLLKHRRKWITGAILIVLLVACSRYSSIDSDKSAVVSQVNQYSE